jgi:hypothetical protein
VARWPDPNHNDRMETVIMANHRIPPFDPPSTWPSFWLGYISGLCTGIGLTLIVLIAIVLR